MMEQAQNTDEPGDRGGTRTQYRREKEEEGRPQIETGQGLHHPLTDWLFAPIDMPKCVFARATACTFASSLWRLTTTTQTFTNACTHARHTTPSESAFDHLGYSVYF